MSTVAEALVGYGPTHPLHLDSVTGAAYMRYLQEAAPFDGIPWYGQDARLALLVQCVMGEGGYWADVVALARLDLPSLWFLDVYAVRPAWLRAGGVIPDPREVNA